MALPGQQIPRRSQASGQEAKDSCSPPPARALSPPPSPSGPEPPALSRLSRPHLPPQPLSLPGCSVNV